MLIIFIDLCVIVFCMCIRSGEYSSADEGDEEEEDEDVGEIRDAMIDNLNAEEADADEVERLEGRNGDAVDSESEGSDGRPKVDETRERFFRR
jgi:hypothetical protein